MKNIGAAIAKAQITNGGPLFSQRMNIQRDMQSRQELLLAGSHLQNTLPISRNSLEMLVSWCLLSTTMPVSYIIGLHSIPSS